MLVKSSAIIFFCDEPKSKHQPLRDAMIAKVTERVKRYATELQDQRLITKLSSSDLVAKDARCHASCFVKRYNSSSRCAALVELIGFIEDTQNNNKDVIPVF